MQPEPGFAAASILVSQWVALGLRDAFVSPGARSTPLVLALAAADSVRKHIVTDERSSAFAALGCARETAQPVLLVCTSGTAGANYFPAVVEASLARVPLLIATADRPVEAQDWRAPQTIAQTELFANFTRWRVALPSPCDATPNLDYLRATACRAWAVARDDQGPVHLNLPFREPLLAAQMTTDSEGLPESLLETVTKPHLDVHSQPRSASPAALNEFRALVDQTRGVIVCGPDTGGRVAANSVRRLAHQLGWPVLADPLSGLRSIADDHVIDAYDVLLRDQGFVAAHLPDVIVRFGALPASKPLTRFLAGARQATNIVIADGDWPDPNHAGGMFVRAHPQVFCEQASTALGEHWAAQRTDALDWTRQWSSASQSLRQELNDLLASADPRFTGRVAATLASLLPPDSLLTVGNSMPIRDLDTWVATFDSDVVANRGANGIDGVLSTALGAAQTATRPNYLYLGDQSLLHDAGALTSSLARNAPLRIVVANDDGGGIFEQLPQQRLGEVFERYFAAPHGHSLAALASAAGLASEKCASSADLPAALAALNNVAGTALVEVSTDRDLDRQLRAELPQQALARVLGGAAVPHADQYTQDRKDVPS